MVTDDLPVELYQNDQIRTLEKIAIETYAITEEILMDRAGTAAFNLLQEKWPDAERIVVVCGPGNNGGDGYILAHLAHQAGIDVDVYYLGDIQKLQGAAQAAAQKCIDSDLVVQSILQIINDDMSLEEQDLDADLIVDAIFGTGLQRDIEGIFQQAIELINLQDADILAIDTPSGINSNTGLVQGVAICADVTCTFIGLKQGLVTGDGPDYVGELFLSELDIPEEAFSIDCSAMRMNEEVVEENLPVRHATAHKGDYGHVLIVGGNYGMPGSVRMAAEAAGRTGAGLVSVATRREHIACVVNMRPEIMCHSVESSQELQPLLDKASVVVLGPGLGQDQWAQDLFSFIIDNFAGPKVVDADGLNLLAQNPNKSNNWVLTPHPGEAARLLNETSTTIQSDRFSALERLQKTFGGVILLKGAGSLIQGDLSNGGEIKVIDAGNPGMASGGMGDVLSGIIGGLIAQGLELETATQVGAWVHATAGDKAANSGERGLLATDLMPFIRQLVNP